MLHGRDKIAAFYRTLLADQRIERFEPVRRWHGEDQVVDESVLHCRVLGTPFGLAGHGRAVRIRLLHLFDFADVLISRQSAWLDIAGLQQQLADDGWTAGGGPGVHGRELDDDDARPVVVTGCLSDRVCMSVSGT